MAKKKSAKNKPKLVNLRDRVCKTEEEWIERLILMSENAITKQGSSIDDFFRQQAERLRRQLKELKSGKR